jgi:NitT/TauT family transport system ATP-binding protein
MTAVVPIKAVTDPAPIKAASLGGPQRPLLRLTGVAKAFNSGTVALAGVDLTIRPGEFVSLLGPSGCGKSTLLKIIAALATPSAGEIDWPQSMYDAMGSPEPELGFVFQEPTLLPWRTAADNVRLPLLLASTNKKEARDRVAEALALVGLSAFANQHPRQLSGGMKMRVSIARALRAAEAHRHLRHPQRLRVGLSLDPDRGDELAAWPGQRGYSDRGALP